MKTPFKMFEVTLEGDARERGRQHGEALRGPIRDLWGLGEEALRRLPGGLDGYLDRVVGQTGFLQAARRWTPDLVEEVEGLAEGANLPFRAAFAIQLVDERDWAWEATSGGGATSRCSALGAYGEPGGTLIAQNIDGGAAADGFMTLLHHHDPESGWEAHTVTYPGVIGTWGLNNAGIGVCLNAMGAFMNHSSHGLGTIFMARGVLAQTTLLAAERFVAETPHASGENYLIGAKDGVVDYEGSTNCVVRYIPRPGAIRVFHTNHPVVNSDVLLTPEVVAGFSPDRQERYRLAMANTRTRFEALERRLRDMSQPVTVESAKEALCSHDSDTHPVCRHRLTGEAAMTTASVIMELAEDPVLHVASGPPCMSEFRTFRFRG